jgi:two-component system, chemotaxis family, response regulator Rcp1
MIVIERLDGALRWPHAPVYSRAGEDEPGARGWSSKSPAPPDSKPCILLVEDNSGDVLLVRESLREHGLDCELMVIDDGQKAIDYLQKLEREGLERPALVVLDLNLPRRSGRDILMVLRASPAWAATPVVILSSSEAPDDRAFAAAMGAALYIRKPIDLEEFMAIGGVLRRMLEGQMDASA